MRRFDLNWPTLIFLVGLIGFFAFFLFIPCGMPLCSRWWWMAGSRLRFTN